MHTHTHTNTLTHTDTHTTTGIQTHRHTDTQTHRHTHTHPICAVAPPLNHILLAGFPTTQLQGFPSFNQGHWATRALVFGGQTPSAELVSCGGGKTRISKRGLREPKAKGLTSGDDTGNRLKGVYVLHKRGPECGKGRSWMAVAQNVLEHSPRDTLAMQCPIPTSRP